MRDAQNYCFPFAYAQCGAHLAVQCKQRKAYQGIKKEEGGVNGGNSSSWHNFSRVAPRGSSISLFEVVVTWENVAKFSLMQFAK
jgi:hypothetical protein